MQENTNDKQDLAALAADATPGPWKSEQDFGANCPECGEWQMAEAFVIRGATHGGVCVVLFDDFADANARFIAAARTAVPAMAAELAALRARVAEAEAHGYAFEWVRRIFGQDPALLEEADIVFATEAVAEYDAARASEVALRARVAELEREVARLNEPNMFCNWDDPQCPTEATNDEDAAVEIHRERWNPDEPGTVELMCARRLPRRNFLVVCFEGHGERRTASFESPKQASEACAMVELALFGDDPFPLPTPTPEDRPE